jgi:hypothetical protein
MQPPVENRYSGRMGKPKMRTNSGTTKAGPEGVKGGPTIEYAATWQEFESVDEAITQVGDDAALTKVINARGQKQGATQTGKGPVRTALLAALAEHDIDEVQAAVNAGAGETELLQAVAEAVEKHQSSMAEYVMGRTRGTTAAGMNKTAARRGADALMDDPERAERYKAFLIEEYGEAVATRILAGEDQ